MDNYILEMRDIRKEFPGVVALDNVTFRVKQGEIHALVGENGAGKSTLMKVLSGVYQKDRGQLILEGEEQKFTNVKESEAAGVAIVHQELNIVKNLTVCENIFLGGEYQHRGIIDWKRQYKRAREVLDIVGLDVSPNTVAEELSPGQQQILEIAKAINKDVKVLIFDEPTSSLTELEAKKLLELMRTLQKKGLTLIYISHKLDEIFEIAETVTVLRDGKTIVTKPIEELDRNSLISYMVGRELTNLYPPCTHTVGEIAFEVENWNVPNRKIPDRMLLENINIHAYHGEILGIAGLMGAGRTELALSLFGAEYKKTSGTMKINGVEKTIHSPEEAIKNKIGYVTEDRKKLGLVLGQSIRENITLANFSKLSKHGVINNNKEILEVTKYAKELHVKTPSIMQLTRFLSGGNQQKVILAKWLMTEPDILIIDEPTRGIDVGAKYEIYSILDSLAAAGKCVIIISSEMPEIIGVCDRAYVMNEGKICGELSKDEITQERMMECIQSGGNRRE